MKMRMRRTRARDNKSKDNVDNTTIKKKTSTGDEDAGHGHGLCNIIDVKVIKCLKYSLNHHHHNEKELNYLLTSEFENSWNVSSCLS